MWLSLCLWIIQKKTTPFRIRWKFLLIFNLFVSIRFGFFFSRSVCTMLWFVYLNERARDRRQSEQFIVQEAVWHRRQCIHARMTIEISIYSLFNWNGNKPNKAAGISSSLIVTYLFFIFRAIACIVVVSFVHNAVALCTAWYAVSVHSKCQQNLCETPSPFRFSFSLFLSISHCI